MSNHTISHVSHITNEHREWLRGIEFYNIEIDILKKRLAEVSQDYTDPAVKAQVEHFQNQFIIQINNLDELRSAIKKHENHLDNDAANHAQHITKETLSEHETLRENYYGLEKIINELRHEFNKFLVKYM